MPRPRWTAAQIEAKEKRIVERFEAARKGLEYVPRPKYTAAQVAAQIEAREKRGILVARFEAARKGLVSWEGSLEYVTKSAQIQVKKTHGGKHVPRSTQIQVKKAHGGKRVGAGRPKEAGSLRSRYAAALASGNKVSMYKLRKAK